MKKQIAEKSQTAAQALLEGLIAECHAIIREELVPAAHDADGMDKHNYVLPITELMDSAVKLADAVGRLRSPAAPPELRQRITVERIQRLSPPEGEGGGTRS